MRILALLTERERGMYGIGVHPASLQALKAGRLSNIGPSEHVDLFFYSRNFLNDN